MDVAPLPKMFLSVQDEPVVAERERGYCVTKNAALECEHLNNIFSSVSSVTCSGM